MAYLTNNQNIALEKAKDGHSMVILGQSGTGKSYIIKRIASELRSLSKHVALTATTGIAALTINGKTVHSWCGLGDGRDSGELLFQKLASNTHYACQKENILKTDCLIIDEISMLSLKLFETIEYVCRKLRNSDIYFGGIQLIVVGDFFQLPPVPDYLKLDNGDYCFNSFHFQNFLKHRIILKQVMRQCEIDFIKCINDISRGDLPEDSHNLIKRLRRPLPPGPDAIRLCGRNFDCDVYNASKLIDMEGDACSFVSIDSGEKHYLSSISVPQELHLKVNSPVMLLKNLSTKLVNGLKGKVTSITKNIITVYFEDISQSADLKQETFSVYSSLQDKVLASRVQFPLSLAFSITIHKSQGLTLDRVEVDASNIFSPGQLGVAIGRTKVKKSLRILNFNSKSVMKHKQSMYEFYQESERASKDFSKDNLCCPVNYVDPVDTNLEQDFQISEHHLISQRENHNVGIDEELSDFSDEEINQIDEMCTTGMPQDFSAFENLLKSKCDILFNTIHGTATHQDNLNTSSKSWTNYYTEIYKFSTSSEYEKLVRDQVGRKPTSEDFDTCRNSFDKVTSLILKENTKSLEKSQVFTQIIATDSEAGTGKIRYIGGRCIAKSRYHFMKCTRTSMYKKGKTHTAASHYLKVKMLDYLTCSENVCNDLSKYPKSLEETKRKQNISCGLTSINDQTFEFFLIVNKKRKLNENLQLHGSNCLKHILDKLIQDTDLFITWTNLFSSFDDVDHSTLRVNDNMAKSSLKELFEDIIYRFSRIGDNQFRKDVLRKMEREKTERLRKRIVSKDKLFEKASSKANKGSKRKEKAKVISAKKRKTTSNQDDCTVCPLCKKVYADGDKWIACDKCDRWFDNLCLAFSDSEWAALEDVDWLCPDCK